MHRGSIKGEEVLTVGERISAAMGRLGLNDSQLARRIGVSRTTIIWWKADKRQRTGALAVQVTVFRLEVTDELATWPECNQRKRSWFNLMEAASLVEEPDLQNFIRHLPNGTSMD